MTTQIDSKKHLTLLMMLANWLRMTIQQSEISLFT